MIIRDLNDVFSGNKDIIEEMKKLIFVSESRIKKEVDKIKNNENEDIVNLGKLSRKEIGKRIISTNEKLKLKQEDILNYISSYIKFRTEKKHKMSEINLKIILDIAEKNSFSKFIIISLFFTLCNNEEDSLYVKCEIMDSENLEYQDVIYYIYTNKILNKNTSLFSRSKIQSIIKDNYKNEQIVNTLYLSCQSYLLTGEGRDIKFITSLIKSIPNFFEDIKETNVDKNIIILLEVFLENRM